MIEINSYILKPNHGKKTFKTYEDFINIKDSIGLLNLSGKVDSFYLDGAIEIKYYDEIYLDINNWDLVDQLWSYILNIIEEYLESGCGEMNFPDSPNVIAMEKLYGNNLKFSIITDKKRTTVLNENIFLNILLEKADEFFKAISVLMHYGNESLCGQERIQNIKKILQYQNKKNESKSDRSDNKDK